MKKEYSEIVPRGLETEGDLFDQLESKFGALKEGETTNKEFLEFLSQLPVWENPKESYRILEMLCERFREQLLSPFLKNKKEESSSVILYPGSSTMKQEVDADQYFDVEYNRSEFYVSLLDILQNKVLENVFSRSGKGQDLGITEDHKNIIAKIFKELLIYFERYNRLDDSSSISYESLLKTKNRRNLTDKREAGFTQLGTAIYLLGECKCDGSESGIVEAIGAAPGFELTKLGAGNLSKINPQLGAELLLRKLDSDCSEHLKRKYARTLYHLELGKIGVDKGVVDYLERKYVLEGGNKDLAAFAQRISGDGKIGVFDNEGNMLGYIEMGDLTDKEKIKSAQILDLSRDLLFTDPNTPDEIRQQFMQDYSRFYTQIFFQETGVYFNNLSLRAQLWFYEYVKKADPVAKEEALKVAKQFGEAGIKTFIAVEQDGAAGEAIFAIVKSEIGGSTKKRIFETYAQLVDAAEGLRKYLLANFKSQVFNEEIINQMIIDILLKGSTLIADFADKVQTTKGVDQTQTNLEILQKLSEINVKVLVFADVLKYLPREEVANLNLQEIPSIEKVEDISGIELSKRRDLVEKMKDIIRKQFPTGDDELFEQELLKTAGLRFTISLIDGEVISFFAKKSMGEHLDYIDWFISNPSTPIKGLGEATIKMGLNPDQSRGTSYYAVAKPHVRSFPIFIESLGFVAFSGSTADGEYKHHYARISRLTEDNKLAAKTMLPEKQAEFRQTIITSCVEAQKVISLVFYGKVFEVCKVEFEKSTKDQDDFTKDDSQGWIMAELERQSNKGNVLSSYIPEVISKSNRVFYAVFEKDINVGKREEINVALSRPSESVEKVASIQT